MTTNARLARPYDQSAVPEAARQQRGVVALAFVSAIAIGSTVAGPACAIGPSAVAPGGRTQVPAPGGAADPYPFVPKLVVDIDANGVFAAVEPQPNGSPSVPASNDDDMYAQLFN